MTPLHSLDDLNEHGMRVGGETETVSLRMAQERLPNAKIMSYATPADAYVALQSGKIDAVAYDKPPLEYAAAQNDAFYVLDETVGVGHIAVGAPFRNKELMNRVNEFIKLYKEDGTYDEMYNRWVKTKDPVLPDIPKPENPINKGKPLLIGNDPQNIPMSFLDVEKNQMSGFDTEFVMRLAVYLNMDFEFELLYYDALFPAVESGKLDLAVGNLDKTPEREETMLFSDDYIDCPAGIMVLKSRWLAGAEEEEAQADSEQEEQIARNLTFYQKLKRSFKKTFIVENRWRLLLQGLLVTIYITVVATVLGTLLAFVQCCMRRSKRAWLRYPAKVYIAVVQGTPILVILLIMYYVVFTNLKIQGEMVAAIALAFNFAAYAGEMMRTGVDGIDKGLIEAARALGFGRFDVFRKVIFPIATRRIMPVYKGEFISLLKTTSIVGYVAIQDLTKASDIVRGKTYEAFFPLIATAVIYFTVAHLLASGFAYLEYHLNPVNRRRAQKGQVNE
ncbi:MAG: ABC transporter substrate-binding protein/permease [Planctomycetia bacterium]|nr:ABC transporter substrate-binding protein/permease [Planctomycetia bacterium]